MACPDNNHPHAIDLGLPSGTKWACCNVGASTPGQYGYYFAWGETQPKNNYDWTNYAYWHDDNGDEMVDAIELVNIGSDIAGTDYDAATANWGSPWCMPTLEQIQELVNKCSPTKTFKYGVSGCECTGPNGGTIFLPSAGYRYCDTVLKEGTYGYFLSSTLHKTNYSYAYNLYTSGFATQSSHDRCYGRNVRPVRKD